MGAGLRPFRAAFLGLALGVAAALVALSVPERAIAAPAARAGGRPSLALADLPPLPVAPAPAAAPAAPPTWDGALALRAAEFAAVLDEASRRLCDTPEQARRAKAILLVAALHESNGFRARVQGDLDGDGDAEGAALGPARGLLQMEPATFHDLWRHARDDWRVALAGAAGVSFDTLAAEVARIDPVSNAWDDSGVRALLESNDLFAATAARCDMKRSPEPLDPAVDPESEIDSSDRRHALAEAWFRWVKKACGRGQCRETLIGVVAEKARVLERAPASRAAGVSAESRGP
jgi:hypothetical protein